MEMLGISETSTWIRENQGMHQHIFSQTPLNRFSGLGAETMQSEHVSLGQNELHACGAHTESSYTAGQPVEYTPPVDGKQYMPPPMTAPEYYRGRDAGEDNCHLPPARKLQKADRERLRRDHLNEQFAKLANVLDPIRPKFDKGTILTETILALKELRSEISRMKNDHIALSDESRDLSQEKAELREEKTLLETETGRLQDQRNQSADNQSVLTGWKLDHPGLMSSPQFPYPLLVPSITKSSEDIPQADPTLKQTHHVPESPFFSAFMHPAYQNYGMFDSMQSPYMPYAHFPHPGHHTHVQRPAARYPAPIHPTPIYPATLPKSAQAKSADPSIVVTDLQLQTPGLVPPTIQHPDVSEDEQREKMSPAKVGRALDVLGDSVVTESNAASADEQLAPQLSLASNSTAL